MVTMAIKDLSAGYGNKTIIRDINFSVRSGDILTLLGANGQGKTTLLKTMAGFMKPFSGTVTIEGKNIRKMDKKTLAGYLSYVPQNHVTGIAFTVRDMVVLGRIARCNFYASPARKDYEEAESSLEKLGLLHLADKNYQELSGGEQRLVLIARALTQHT
ncbi:MAG: ABC transporter ATP-binding protein, partial [Sphaerochaetaceae bacterium]